MVIKTNLISVIRKMYLEYSCSKHHNWMRLWLIIGALTAFVSACQYSDPTPLPPPITELPPIPIPEPPSSQLFSSIASNRNDGAIAQVLSGQLTTANAAWWGFDADDATHAIQSAINSGATKVVIPYVGSDWNVRPLRLASQQEIDFDPGVVVVAKNGAFRGPQDCLFRGQEINKVTLRGYGAVLRMRKEEYREPDYEKSEFRHVLGLFGATEVTVQGLTLQSSGGDGIYIGPTWDSRRIPCRRIDIKDCVLADNFRQGISIVSAETVLIENCLIRDTIGTSPQAGIDFEPADASDLLVDIQVRNCVAKNNAGAGFAVGLSRLDERSTPISVKVVNCLIRGPQSLGILGLLKTDKQPRGTVEFQDCTCENMEYAGLACNWNLASSLELRFGNCKWGNVARGTSAPFYLELTGQRANEVQGGIRFVDCYIYDDKDRDPIRVLNATTGDGFVQLIPPTLFANVDGNITVVNEAIDHSVPLGWPLPNLIMQLQGLKSP